MNSLYLKTIRIVKERLVFGVGILPNVLECKEMKSDQLCLYSPILPIQYCNRFLKHATECILVCLLKQDIPQYDSGNPA